MLSEDSLGNTPIETPTSPGVVPFILEDEECAPWKLAYQTSDISGEFMSDVECSYHGNLVVGIRNRAINNEIRNESDATGSKLPTVIPIWTRIGGIWYSTNNTSIHRVTGKIFLCDGSDSPLPRHLVIPQYSVAIGRSVVFPYKLREMVDVAGDCRKMCVVHDRRWDDVEIDPSHLAAGGYSLVVCDNEIGRMTILHHGKVVTVVEIKSLGIEKPVCVVSSDGFRIFLSYSTSDDSVENCIITIDKSNGNVSRFNFGREVTALCASLNYDGSVIAIGRPGKNFDEVDIWECKHPNVWELTSKHRPNFKGSPSDNNGDIISRYLWENNMTTVERVHLSDNAATLAVVNVCGAIIIYVRYDDDEWSPEHTIPCPAEIVNVARFTCGSSLSGDGNTLAVFHSWKLGTSPVGSEIFENRMTVYNRD